MTVQAQQTQLRLENLIEIIRLMMEMDKPDELLRTILESAVQFFSAEACSIALFDEEGHHLSFAFSVGGAGVREFRIDLGQGIAGWVARNGEGVISNDVSKDPRFYDGIDRKTGFKTKSILCAPLKQQLRVIGAIEVLNTANRDGFNDEDLHFLMVLGRLAGTVIDRVKVFVATQNSHLAMQEMIQGRYHFVTGSSAPIQEAVRLARTVAPRDATVLLLGETGTGKEVMARAIHQWSPRVAHPFVATNCVALTPGLMESELFGHEKGAFTGAVAQKKGRFELANGGTIFLDEIGELPPMLQVKLLRVLQEKEFQRVGGTQDIRANVRIIAATNRDLPQAVRYGDFREDLYYRLNVVSVTMPPLRNRKEDIPLLVEHFIDHYCRELKCPKLTIDPAAVDVLKGYSWPGNVRELKNVIERAVVLCSGLLITKADLPVELLLQPAGPLYASLKIPRLDEPLPMAKGMDQFKRALIQKALERAEGNQAEAAKILGLQRSNLSRMMRALGLR